MKPIQSGLKFEKHGNYLRLVSMHDHPISCINGTIPYHRYLLYEAMGRPNSSECHWCGHPLLWKSNLPHPVCHIVNVDHLDFDPQNNDLENLVCSCMWCNANRGWAEKHEIFWSLLRKWMKSIPPGMRPNPIEIARDLGINPEIKRKENKNGR